MFSSLSYPTIISLVLASLMMCISCTTATVAADPITSSSTHSRTSTQSSYQPLSVDEMKSLFLQFTHKHNKFYQGPKEYQQRFEIFSQNVEKSRQMNLLEGRNTYGVTKFSDLSPEEFKKYYLMEPKTPQLMMSSGVNRNGVLPISRVSQQQVRDAPKSWDWRDHGAVTYVKNQGQCGSCWAFSATGNIEGQWYLKTKKLKALSEQQLVDCDHNCVIFENQQSCDSGCDGGLQCSAYQYIIQAGGIASEDAYPYYAESYTCTVKPSQFVAKLQNWTMLSTNETELAAWLAENGPIAVALNADWLQNYNNGIGDPAWCDPTQLDHGVLGYFRIIRNKGRCGINTVPSTSIV
nr:unnamed protein product [Naegleria fowleri]